MKSIYYISETEREVMEMLWRFPEWKKQSEILEIFHKEGKEWKRQTLNTFLSRLEEKGLVVREHRMVRAVYTEKEYNCLQMQEAVENIYDGKISNLMLALTENTQLSEDEANKLYQIIQENRLKNILEK